MKLASSSMCGALLVSAVAFVGCSGGGGGGASSPEGGGLVDKPAPSFSAEPVQGDVKSLDDLKGKVVILDFWATFCGPCKESFPKYQSIVDASGGKVVVLAVSEDDPEQKDDIKKFIKDTGVKFPVVWDKDKSIAKDKYDVKKMPTSFIIDPSGTVKFVHASFHEGDDDKISEEVKSLSK